MKIFQFHIKQNGFYPNNAALPVLLYKGALHLPEEGSEELVKEVFAQHDWSNCWVGGIYSYHHYHSITHEVLGVTKGTCTIMLGGEKGIKQLLEKGDVLVLPAGVSHKSIASSDDFTCVGAYPQGLEFDLNYGKAEEHPAVDENILNVPLPATDPLYGKEGPLTENWKRTNLKEKVKSNPYSSKKR